MILERDFPPDLRVEMKYRSNGKGIEVHVACYTKDSVESYIGYTIHRKDFIFHL